MESSNLRLIEEIKALRRSEERCRLLLENLQDLVCLMDQEGAYQYVSPSYQDELGYAPEDLLGKSAFNWIHPDDLEAVQKRFQALIKTGVTQEVPFRYQSAGGEYLWFQSRGKLVRDSQGGVTGVVVSSRNITLRKKMEKSLRESEERYRSLVEHAPAFITINDREGRMLFINRVLPEYDLKQVYQSSTYDHILPEYHEQVRKAFEKVFSQGAPQSYQLQSLGPDGEIVWYQTNLGPIWEGKAVVAATQVAIDITPLKEAEAALREREERLRLMLEGTDEGLWDWDVAGGEIQLDDNWIRVLGYVPGERPFDFAWWESNLHADSRPVFEQALAAYLEGRTKYYEIEYRMRAKSGEWRWIWARGVCVAYDREGRPLRLMGTHRDITERKRTEDALRESEANYQTLVEQSVQGLIVLQGGRIVFANSALADICGYPVEELQSLSAEKVVALIHPEDQALVWGHFQDRLGGKAAPPRYQYRGVSKDGSVRWLEMAASLITYGGQPAIQGSIIDITERTLAEEALRQSNLVVENSPVVLFRWRASEGWPVDMVSRNVSQFGYSPEELLSGAVPFAAMVHPEDRERVAREVEEYSAGGADRFQQEYRIVTKDGGVHWVDDRTVVERDVAGQIISYQGIIIDINDRKRTEAALDHSHRLMRYIIEHNRSAIAVHDRELRYVYVSRRYLDDYKVKEQDVIGRHHYDVFPDLPQKWREVHRKALAGEISSAEDDPYERDDGSVDWTRWECRPWYEADGSIGGIIIYTEVITERKRVEEALRASLEEKESLLKEVHHRVKNNLQVISSLLSLQFRQVKNDEVRSFLRDTQNRIRSMATLHEILYRSGTVARINFPDYVKGLCVHLARSYNSAARSIRLRQEIANVALNLDQAVTAGLIINELVTNAFKHAFPSHSGGEILVALMAADEGHLLLRVSDDGVGFPPERPPQSTEKLGLLLVKNLSRQLEGRLSVGSGPATVFEIVFPHFPVERGSE